MFETFGGPLTVREVPDPTPSLDGVVVEVGATGVCRSDWHAWSGHDGDVVLPHVPGHELAGTVAAVGTHVRRWSVGDRVTVPFVCGCGRCEPCRRGAEQVCLHQTQPGFTHWGSFAELVALDAADVNLVALPDELPFVAAAALGCRFATAFRAVTAVGRVQREEWVAVLGCGGVGLSAVQVAVAAGARVVAVDPSPAARAQALAMGASHAVAAPAGVWDLTGGGAHLSLDCLGSPATCVASIRLLRPQGRHVQVGLLPPALGRPEVPMELVVARELAVLGSHGMSARDYPEMLAQISAGRLRPQDLVSRELTLDEAGEALAQLGRSPGVEVVTRF